MKLPYFTSPMSPERYNLFKQANVLVFIGYLIVSAETFLAIYLKLTDLTYGMTLLICVPVLLLSFIFILFIYFKEKLIVLHEIIIFGLYVISFAFAFSVWIFHLGGLRFLGILNVLTAVTIVISYTNVLQSLLMSMSAFTCYYLVILYSIKFCGQPGSFLKESFLAFCLLPAFLLISSASNYMTRKRNDLQAAKTELETLYVVLSETNDKLKREQLMTGIEMELAGEIQRAVLPGKVPDITGWDLAFFTKPSGTVSGDFYDFYYNGNTLNGMSLFDVSGHGVAPALITILAKPQIYSNFNCCGPAGIGSVLESINSILQRELEDVHLYITGLIIRIDGDSVEYANAGHPDLLYYKASFKKVEVAGDTGMSFKGQPVGISLSGCEYLSVKFKVDSGDFLILYSDGLTEQRNQAGEQYGINRLTNAVSSYNGNGAEGILKNIIDSLENFSGDIKAMDDITVIVAGKK